MKKTLLTLLLGIFLAPLFSQTTIHGTLSSTDQTFNRPDEGAPPTTLSIIGTNVYYNVITLNITTPGLITMISSSLFDNFAILYGPGGFSPAAPLTNAIVASDDYVGPNAGFTYDFTTPGVYYLVICSFKNNVVGAYSITTSAAVVLPFKLVSFTAAKTTDNRNIIQWITAEERNLTTYQVQHSMDNKQFQDMANGSVVAKNTITGTNYSFTDINPAKGYNYYRLSIREQTGQLSFSPVAVVKNLNATRAMVRVFPNPSTDFLKIEVKGLQNSKSFVSIVNLAGVLLQSGEYIFNNQGILSVNIKKLPAGRYFLKTTIEKNESVVAFIKN